MRFDASRDLVREDVAVDRKSMAPRHSSDVGSLQQKRVQTPRFLLQQPGRRMNLFALERVTAYEFAERIRFVRWSALQRAHLVQNDVRACFRCLKGGLASGETGSDDVN